MPSPVLIEPAEVRNSVFDLAIAVLERDRAEREQSETAEFWRVRSRALAKRMMTTIARDAVSA